MIYTNSMEIATFGGGCFWCTEAIFQRLRGVANVVSGYTGGKREHPTYEQVSTGATNHAEAVQITFDPNVISFDKLLEIFFATHDPTTLNQQGADIGTQYRSVVFYHNEKQKQKTENMIDSLNSSHQFSNPIVTQVLPFESFYDAESYHQNYYNDNKLKNPYCSLVIDPKVKKLLEEYKKDVKEEYLPK